MPKSLADARMRHGYCTAELIIWYILKQLILPPDINEVTMQKEMPTPPQVLVLYYPPPWTKPRNGWKRCSTGSTYASRRSRTSTLGRWTHLRQSLSVVIHYHRANMVSEFLIEVKLSEQQDKIAQIVTGANGTQMKPTAYDEHVNASKGKIRKRERQRWKGNNQELETAMFGLLEA